MNNKRLNWNKENIEKAQIETERLMMKYIDDDDKRMTYGIIRALLWAVGFILDEMHKGEKTMEMELPRFTKMAESEPRKFGNYVVLVRDKETREQGLSMDYWDDRGWDDYSLHGKGKVAGRYEVVAYTRCFEERGDE